MNKYSLNYLQNKPRRVNWKVVAGPPISYYEQYDLLFDDYDLRIRQLGKYKDVILEKVESHISKCS